MGMVEILYITTNIKSKNVKEVQIRDTSFGTLATFRNLVRHGITARVLSVRILAASILIFP